MRWLDKALCRGQDIRDFFEHFERGTSSQKALVINLCNECPVQPECYAYASSNKDTEGFWAGYYFRKGLPRNPERIRISGNARRLYIRDKKISARG